MERETGFEPATSTLARSHSTTELFPLNEENFYIITMGLSRNNFSGMDIYFDCLGTPKSWRTQQTWYYATTAPAGNGHSPEP